MRLAAVSAVASVVVLSAGSAALADPVSSTVTVGKNTKVVNTRIDPSVEQSTIISFLTVRIDGKKTPVYCAEFGTPLADNQTYLEGDSDKSGINKLGAISNLLAHAYPAVSAEDLIDAADTAMPEPAKDGHSMFDDAAFLTYVATQASVWELSNPNAFKLGDTFIDALNVNAGQYAVIVAVHKYLTQFFKAFKPELTITPATATATVGGKAGPFTVKTEGGKPDVTLTATGGKAVDSAGNEVTTAHDGDQFWITSDVVGSATVHGEATFKVPAARVLFFGDGDKHGQKLVMGGTKNKKLTAEVTATFTAPSASPSPSPGLPVTGANVTGAAIGGAVLLLAGIGLVLVLRRRRVKFTA
jgi:LPXTG-motif cell wall-anchored protein